ncbi:MAG: hypothetical protein ACOC6G_03290 [Thermoproteota archaeon]
MKKILASLLITVLILGICLSITTANTQLQKLTNDQHKEQEHTGGLELNPVFDNQRENQEPPDEDEENKLEDQDEPPENQKHEDDNQNQDEQEEDNDDDKDDEEDYDTEDDEQDEDDDEDDEEKEENSTKEDKDDDGDEDDDDQDGVDDEKEEQEKRELEIESSDGTAKVESKMEREGMENEFEIYLSSEEGVSIELKYENETDQESEETEVELNLRVQFLTLVEYTDEDGSDTLTENDTVINEMGLTDLSYNPPQVTPVVSEDGETGYGFETVSQGNFAFNITAVFFPTYAVVDSSLVTPTETKITISITDYPFEQEDSLLALQVNADSKMEIDKETETTDSEVKVTSDTANGYFSWVKWVMVDGENRTVTHSFTMSEEETLINLCYPQGTNIIHDPKLGIGIKTLVPTDIFTLVTPQLIIATGATAIAIMAVAAILTRCKKKSSSSSIANQIS